METDPSFPIDMGPLDAHTADQGCGDSAKKTRTRGASRGSMRITVCRHDIPPSSKVSTPMRRAQRQEKEINQLPKAPHVLLVLRPTSFSRPELDAATRSESLGTDSPLG